MLFLLMGFQKKNLIWRKVKIYVINSGILHFSLFSARRSWISSFVALLHNSIFTYLFKFSSLIILSIYFVINILIYYHTFCLLVLHFLLLIPLIICIKPYSTHTYVILFYYFLNRHFFLLLLKLCFLCDIPFALSFPWCVERTLKEITFGGDVYKYKFRIKKVDELSVTVGKYRIYAGVIPTISGVLDTFNFVFPFINILVRRRLWC